MAMDTLRSMVTAAMFATSAAKERNPEEVLRASVDQDGRAVYEYMQTSTALQQVRHGRALALLLRRPHAHARRAQQSLNRPSGTHAPAGERRARGRAHELRGAAAAGHRLLAASHRLNAVAALHRQLDAQLEHGAAAGLAAAAGVRAGEPAALWLAACSPDHVACGSMSPALLLRRPRACLLAAPPQGKLSVFGIDDVKEAVQCALREERAALLNDIEYLTALVTDEVDMQVRGHAPP